MYIIFLDESGQPGGFDKDNNKLVKNKWNTKYKEIGIDFEQIMNMKYVGIIKNM